MAIRYEPLDGGMAVAVDDFCGFGADALFLARFASPRPGERVVDLGTGCGILPVLLLRDSAAAHVTGVEIQPAAAALARRSVARSGLDGRAAVLCASWTDLDGLLPREGFHLVVCNPPYFPPGSGRESASPAARLARHEQLGTLDEVVAAASRLLRFGGPVLPLSPGRSGWAGCRGRPAPPRAGAQAAAHRAGRRRVRPLAAAPGGQKGRQTRLAMGTALAAGPAGA